MKLALIGAGQRGNIYTQYVFDKKYADIAAVVESDENRRYSAANNFNVSTDFLFSDISEFWAKGKVADTVIIATQDKDHYSQTMTALDLGYDIILEKPISPDPSECLDISRKATKLGRKILVCHVLRYTNFYQQIKEIIETGEIGRVMNICLNENIGNYHIAHSFVRGNWRNNSESSPIIIAKSCHDMDLLTWLADSRAKKLSSYGNLRFFIKDNAPNGSSNRCCNCPCEPDCRFSAYKCYIPVIGDWPATVVTPELSESVMRKVLETSPYGRCVYRCDNDVCDSQVAAIEFENGITSIFCMSGFTNKINRTIRVLCENGEIEGDDSLNKICVKTFSSNQVQEYHEQIIYPRKTGSGHGGGDTGLIDDFFSDNSMGHTSIERSVESHLMAAAAEKSRITGQSIDMASYRINPT